MEYLFKNNYCLFLGRVFWWLALEQKGVDSSSCSALFFARVGSDTTERLLRVGPTKHDAEARHVG
jgi:hypothetical protein